MRTSHSPLLCLVGVTLLAALTACSSPPAEPGDSQRSARPTSDAATTRFLACLQTAGVDARIGTTGGMVVVKESDASSGAVGTGDSTDPARSPLLIEAGSDGTWVAAPSSDYFADDPATQDAYAACETEVPEFAQPEYDAADDPALQEYETQQREAGLAFARCAREAGFAWVADPGEDFGGITIPAETTEGEFRALLAACPAAGVAWGTPDDLGFDVMTVVAEVLGSDGGAFSGSSGSNG